LRHQGKAVRAVADRDLGDQGPSTVLITYTTLS